LTEPDFPYEKKPNESFNDLIAPSPPDGSFESPDQQPSLPPMDNPTPNKVTCQICGKVFKTKEELTMHLETEHQNSQEENVKLKTP